MSTKNKLNRALIGVLTKTPEGADIIASRLEELEKDRERLRGAVSELLKLVPSASCNDFHHSKKDRHEYGGDCGPLARFNEAIASARAAVEETK